jgi:hypothetical protein
MIYFDYFLVRHLRVIIIIKKPTPYIFFYQEKVRHLWVIFNKKMAMEPLGGGDFEMATPPATTTNNKPLPRRT